MRGNVLTLQVFTLLRELTATDYQKANALRVWPMQNGIGNSIVFMNRASKEGGGGVHAYTISG